MATFKGYIKQPAEILSALINHLTVSHSIKDVVYTTVDADGFISLLASDGTTPETITLTCTTEDTGSGSTWSVVGSVSGSLASATATKEGTDYVSAGVVSFTFYEGPQRFKTGDTIVFDIEVGIGTDIWTILKDERSSSTPWLSLRGPGFSGTDYVYLGLELNFNSTDFGYYMKCAGFTGDNPAAVDIDDYPGYTSNSPTLIFYPGYTKYWIHATGAYIICMVKTGAIYNSFYLGFGAKYGTNAVLDYPFVMAASATGGSTALTSTTQSWYNPKSSGYTYNLLLVYLDSAWYSANTANINDSSNLRLFPSNGVSPFGHKNGATAAIRCTRDLNPECFPFTILKSTSSASFGLAAGLYLDLLGCLFCASDLNDYFYVKPENRVEIGLKKYISFPVGPMNLPFGSLLLLDD